MSVVFRCLASSCFRCGMEVEDIDPLDVVGHWMQSGMGADVQSILALAVSSRAEDPELMGLRRRSLARRGVPYWRDLTPLLHASIRPCREQARRTSLYSGDISKQTILYRRTR